MAKNKKLFCPWCLSKMTKNRMKCEDGPPLKKNKVWVCNGKECFVLTPSAETYDMARVLFLAALHNEARTCAETGSGT